MGLPEPNFDHSSPHVLTPMASLLLLLLSLEGMLKNIGFFGLGRNSSNYFHFCPGDIFLKHCFCWIVRFLKWSAWKKADMDENEFENRNNSFFPLSPKLGFLNFSIYFLLPLF